MTALIGNPLLLTSAPASGDDAYQIEKGLRFNGADDPYLHRDPSHWGDSRLWTLSCWVKRSKLDASARQDFFSARGGLSDHFYIGFTNDAIKWWKNGDDSDTGCTTNALFRDHSAWMHVVFVWDTAQATAADRTRLYVNGKRITSFSSATYPAQFEKGKVNRPSVAHQFGAYDNGDYYNFEGYIADPYFIDGLGLSPAAFGQWNSASNWDSKTFALPAPNNGTTWSSTWSDTPDAGSAAGVFNGKLDTSTYWNSAGERTLTTGEFTINNSLRVYSNFNASTVYFKINDVYTPAMPDCGDFSWDEIDLSNHTLPLKVTSLKYKNIGLSGVSFKGFEVDGVQLVDGKTDQTWDEYASSDTINNGVLRSEEVTSETGSYYGSNLKVNLFDGRHQVDGGTPSNVDASSSGKWLKWTPVVPVNFSSKVEVAVASNGNTISLKRVGQGSTDDITTAGAPNTWHTVYSGSGQIEYIQNQAAGGGYNNWEAIRIDGVILKDWKHNENSFHLKFSDTSLNRYLGKDTLNGKIADATGGLPILKTSDDYGDVKDSGYRADSNKSNLVLAVTGEGSIADVSNHADLRNSGSAKTLTAQGNTAVSTEQSRFYGSSIKFDGTGDYLLLSDSTDFEFGTGAYTVECWIRHTSTSGQQTYVSDPGGNTAGIYFYKNSSHKLGLYYSGQIATGETALGANRWYHIAIVRNSGTSTLYLNGLKDGSGSDTTDLTNGNLAFGDDTSGGSGEFTGYMNDLRIYKGVAKYTANFTPPRRNDFAVNNLTAATGLVTVYGSTMLSDGATARFYDPDSNDAYGVASRFNMFDGSLSTRCGNPDSTNVFSWDTSSYSFSGLLEVYGANTAGLTNNIFVNDVDSGVDLPGTAGWTTVGTYNSGINKVHFTANGGINIYAFRVAGTIITDTLEDAPKADEVDSLTDTPTNYGTDEQAGGEVRGNYPTWNPLDADDASTLSQGNLTYINDGSTWNGVRATMAIPAGKWYWEYHQKGADGCSYGIASKDTPLNDHVGGTGSTPAHTWGGANWYQNGSGTGTSLAAMADGDVIGVAYDTASGKLHFSRNGQWYGASWATKTIAQVAAGTDPVTSSVQTDVEFFPAHSNYSSGRGCSVNFGQRAFKYTAPSGFSCLCSTNLPDTFSGDEVNNPSKYFDIKLWDGDSQDDREIKGLKFGPDLIWNKIRNEDGGMRSIDVIRGSDERLFTHNTDAESDNDNEIQEFRDDGFQIGDRDEINDSGNTYVAYNWDAGTSAATASTDGTNITPSAQWKNTAAGFSMSKYTGTGTKTDSVGHALGAKPEFVIIKDLVAGHSYPGWYVKHKDLTSNKNIKLESTAEEWNATGENAWYDGGIADLTSNTVVNFAEGQTTDSVNNVNKSGATYIMYAWTGIPGFSKFGKYDGGGGKPFIYTGFRPHFIIIRATTTGRNWILIDGKRFPHNGDMDALYANSNGTEQNHNAVDILSNGFKIVDDGYSDYNVDADLIYAAWAEHPLKTARAR